MHVPKNKITQLHKLLNVLLLLSKVANISKQIKVIKENVQFLHTCVICIHIIPRRLVLSVTQ